MDIVNKNGKQYFLPTNIRLLRKQKQWSQEELATKVGLNRGNIASYENGTAEPKICNLLKMAHLFGVSLLSLIQSDLKDQDPVQRTAAYQNTTDLQQLHLQMEKYLSTAKEIERVMEGLNICCRYKMKSLDGNLPKEMQLVALHFEELFHDQFGL